MADFSSKKVKSMVRKIDHKRKLTVLPTDLVITKFVPSGRNLALVIGNACKADAFSKVKVYAVEHVFGKIKYKAALTGSYINALVLFSKGSASGDWVNRRWV